MNRRAFLGSALGSATLLTAGVLGGPLVAAAKAAAAGAAAPAARTAAPTRAMFAPLLGRTLTASGSGVRTRLRLVTVGDVLGSPAGSEGNFLLQFESPTPLPDGIYTLSAAGVRGQLLFLSAVYRDADRRYEAVINQLR